tara:strand:- start:31 stop:348 length:318 start_codon:yes stop_codon:yes gene_type:complete
MEKIKHRIGQYTHSYHHGRSGELIYICPLQLDGTVDMVHKDNVCIYFNEKGSSSSGASSGASITFLGTVAKCPDGVEWSGVEWRLLHLYANHSPALSYAPRCLQR